MMRFSWRLSGKFRPLWCGSLFARRYWIIPLLFLALWARWSGLDKSVWEDEVSSFIEARMGIDNPVYRATGSVATGYWTSFKVFNLCDYLLRTGSVVAARLPILLLGLAGVWLGWQLGRLGRNWAQGFTLALMLALWPFKVEWDTQVRYYAITLTLCLAALVAWEAHRLRPDRYGRFLLALVLSLLLALSHLLAVLTIAMPWIYWVWISLARVGRAVRGRERRRRAWTILLLAILSQGLLLGGVTLAAVRLNRGPEWMAVQWAKLTGKPKPVATATAGASPVVVSKDDMSIKLPTVHEALAFVRQGFNQALTPRVWSPAPLLGLGGKQVEFAKLVVGSSHQPRPLTPWFSGWLLAWALAGSVALLFVSPPLLLSLWYGVFSLAILIALNQQNHFLTIRYFTVPGLAGVILVASGVAGVVNLCRWPIHHWRPRWAAYALFLVALVVGVWFTHGTLPLAQQTALNNPQDWKTMYSELSARFPNGALYAGIGTKNIDFYNQIAVSAEARRNDLDYWRSARRNQTLDALVYPWKRDFMLLDDLNCYDGLVLMRYAYWASDYNPFIPPLRASLPPLREQRFKSIRTMVGDLGHRVYVTRGRACLLLRPRLREASVSAAECGRAYRMDCYFEIPGRYEMSIISGPAMRPVRLLAGAQEAPLAQRPLTSAVPTMKSHSATQVTAGTPERPLPYGLAAEWRHGPGEAVPCPSRTDAEYVGQIQAAAEPLHPLTITILFDQSVDKEFPVVCWRCLEPTEDPLTEHCTVGGLRSWLNIDGFCFGVPLRLTQDMTLDLTPQLNLVEVQGGKNVISQNCSLEAWRGVRAGEMFLAGPLKVNLSKARELLNKPLALTLKPMQVDPKKGRTQDDPFLNQAHRFKPLDQYCLTCLQFIDVGGQLQVLLTPPPE